MFKCKDFKNSFLSLTAYGPRVSLCQINFLVINIFKLPSFFLP